jgi:hypothetical protein
MFWVSQTLTLILNNQQKPTKMKHFLKGILLLIIMVVFYQCEKEPESEPIIDITDNLFLNALIERGVDTNNDNLISGKSGQTEHLTSSLKFSLFHHYLNISMM